MENWRRREKWTIEDIAMLFEQERISHGELLKILGLLGKKVVELEGLIQEVTHGQGHNQEASTSQDR